MCAALLIVLNLAHSLVITRIAVALVVVAAVTDWLQSRFTGRRWHRPGEPPQAPADSAES
jgi:hypothetical protein